MLSNIIKLLVLGAEAIVSLLQVAADLCPDIVDRFDAPFEDAGSEYTWDGKQILD